ncbi:MAG: hypothetical protein F3743_07165 [Nitrospinae bacterium]|nr:hypothetical protein [Nitrospinota bacterium]
MIIGSDLQSLNQFQNIDNLFIKGQTREKDPLVRLLNKNDQAMERDDNILFSTTDPNRLIYANEKTSEISNREKTGKHINIEA